ncbi:bifunctional glutamate N-acetyltransferase/amino-acid acetyltransferase ArgJ [Pseudactinotalea sp. HY158]|uniref:bifunctional glutamate N-acetyltransferase/amino-acid acetyltransferase ArgJ n=1 Tax=unclassified Pseudactinotalea TaxID=2649176 RepID=UPI00129C7B5A|nr:bifunctional glutamate N-acetyltransferase/amino-acid acetyltransferase ArgJ [Pseudactinotalea sp. HY158]MPV51169.1 bifunctional glutamate N-acetyltransferase/amino-acid acetyltransferase ArgJ [Pseudactinotalea sp. HY160]QGH69069.1 bifunctional glutamate N-acetyltransferase/amino-acid acetyltransferase ArgJ [Pseudactinotalea sp. HY158]
MSITAPRGFRATGVTAGLKPSGKSDLALVVNDGPDSVAAGVFTTNRVVGAPVTWSRARLAESGGTSIRAVVLNSGGANVCTGPRGDADVVATAERVGAALGMPAAGVLVCSTGLIGEHLPMAVLLPGVDAAAAALAPDGGADAAEAILTTDTVAKEAVATGSGYSVGGMAKGAGMLAPAMATMLAVVTTDAVLTPELAHEALAGAVRATFNRVDSDGCMSTSDTVALLASGASGVTPDRGEFTAALTSVCADLSRALVADAEGASHDIAVEVVGAHSTDAAEAVGRAVARSALFKTAIYGNDPNWGRVLAQVGTVPVEVARFEADDLDVSVNGVMVCRGGGAHRPRTEVDLASARDVHVLIDLHAGTDSATIWTNDLTHDYVHENSAYST